MANELEDVHSPERSDREGALYGVGTVRPYSVCIANCKLKFKTMWLWSRPLLSYLSPSVIQMFGDGNGYIIGHCTIEL